MLEKTNKVIKSARSKALVSAVVVICAQGSALAGQACEGGKNGEKTLISAVQGAGKSSPLEGKQVSVKAVVSATMPGLGGYYLLEEKSDWDSNLASSEGVFVADKSNKPKVGDVVALSAKVSEISELTHLEEVKHFAVCSSNASVEYTQLSLPFSDSLERFEGMPIHLTQELTISDTYHLARFGQMIVSNGRLFQSTNLERPGPKAQKIAKRNRKNQIIIDDGSAKENPKLVKAPDHLYRTGNTVNGVKGVLHYDFGKFMIEPTVEYKIHEANPRKSGPKITKRGNVRVAAFNVLNYFNGDGKGGGFPTRRGASDTKELERQAAKIIAAMKVMDADILGLMEVENDGYGKLSAIADITNRLNKATGDNYDYVRPQSGPLGDASISVGIIYNTDKVSAVGKPAILTQAPFGVKSRMPIAQTFTAKGGNDAFTVVVNHFKSKGSCPKGKGNINGNQRDGQSCWNPLRVDSAKKLLAWLDTAPTGVDDKDILIIGDLNANAKEDPIIAIEQRGYNNLIEKFNGKYAYSFVFRAEAGYLDHALSSMSLTPKVLDTKDWHINADEMRLTDYNMERKSKAEQKALYKADAFRSSDHDPVIVELQLD